MPLPCMLQVFKGQDQSSGAAVAVKQLALSGISADSLQNIMGEIDLLKNLNHRNIVKYIGSFKTRSHLYIILEYMENGALSSHIKPSKFGAFPESLVAVYIQQVLQGLAYLHEQGVVHRDIKGANILTAKEVYRVKRPACNMPDVFYAPCDNFPRPSNTWACSCMDSPASAFCSQRAHAPLRTMQE